MKRISVVMIVCAMLFNIATFAQKTGMVINHNQGTISLFVAYNKTTNLIFPYAVKSVDRGSMEILVQKATGVENVIQLKAGKENFKQTNLTVITSDGQLYSFLLTFAAEPTDLNIRFEKEIVDQPYVQFTLPADNENIIRDLSEKVATKFPFIPHLHAHNFEVGLSVTGIYIKEDVLYFQLHLNNWSTVNYDIDQLRFFIHDQKKSKRTSSQETELQPIKTTGNTKVINGNSSQTVVIAIPKFTIPDQKVLTVQMMEAHGGRHLSFTIKNKRIIQARLI